MENFGAERMVLQEKGYVVLPGVFDSEAVDGLASLIDAVEGDRETFRKTDDLFAIRQFLKEVPGIKPYIFSRRLQHMIQQVCGKGYFVVKSIYFDKPSRSNWFVAYHQDLTISTASKHMVDGFVNWTVKQGQYAVQPPVGILEQNFTIRIHLDETDAGNGALRVVPGSHTKGVIPPAEFAKLAEKETLCAVPRGGVMLMKPLLLHASGRTTNHERRRVIHIECSNTALPEPLQWGEQDDIF